MESFILHGLIIAGCLGSAGAYIRHFPNKQIRVGRYATGLLIFRGVSSRAIRLL